MTADVRVAVAMAMVCLVCGCAGAESGPSGKRALRPDGSEHAASRPDGEPRATRTQTARSRVESPVTLSALNASEVDHQVRTLREAIALYEQFIERAAGQLEMKEAVQRSRERSEDAQETIRFLLQGQSPGR
jgi:hypothetical protein